MNASRLRQKQHAASSPLFSVFSTTLFSPLSSRASFSFVGDQRSYLDAAKNSGHSLERMALSRHDTKAHSGYQATALPPSSVAPSSREQTERTRRESGGWSFAHGAITRNDVAWTQLDPIHALQRQEEVSPQENALQQNAITQVPLHPVENTTGLPDRLKSGIENLSGFSLDDVHVHYHSSQPAQVQARAYTQGTEIHVAPGQEQHLAHEAWHVVQQKQGRVTPTTQAKGLAINDEPLLEQEAEVMGDKVLHLPNNTTFSSKRDSSTPSADAPIQCWREHNQQTGQFEENGRHPRNFIPLDGHWIEFRDAFNTNVSNVLLSYDANLAATQGNVVDTVRVLGDIHGTNTTTKRDKGCSLFVLADYLGMTAMQFMASVKDDQLKNLIMQIMQVNGTTDEVFDFFTAFLVFTQERFDSQQHLLDELEKDKSHDPWSGAVAWDGHVIRGAKEGRKITFWDPQGAMGNYLLPAGTPMFFFTFHGAK